MKRVRKRLLSGFVLLLVVTWVGGWHTHARELEASAQARYRLARERDAEWRAREPEAEVSILDRLRAGGPATGVRWAVPLFPGLLIADSYEILGPMKERGTAKLLVYYGCGTVTLCELWGIIA